MVNFESPGSTLRSGEEGSPLLDRDRFDQAKAKFLLFYDSVPLPDRDPYLESLMDDANASYWDASSDAVRRSINVAGQSPDHPLSVMVTSEEAAIFVELLEVVTTGIVDLRDSPQTG